MACRQVHVRGFPGQGRMNGDEVGLGALGRIRLDDFARHAGDLEASVGVALVDVPAESHEALCDFAAVIHTDQFLPMAERLVH